MTLSVHPHPSLLYLSTLTHHSSICPPSPITPLSVHPHPSLLYLSTLTHHLCLSTLSPVTALTPIRLSLHSPISHIFTHQPSISSLHPHPSALLSPLFILTHQPSYLHSPISPLSLHTLTPLSSISPPSPLHYLYPPPPQLSTHTFLPSSSSPSLLPSTLILPVLYSLHFSSSTLPPHLCTHSSPYSSHFCRPYYSNPSPAVGSSS
ncbi:hypothetical protein Pcinc_020042 [Petrolisthes cinctipes]|uniref:Uncharacterized protein n=1 Tax=Petrolisthes cinctipes TaxID=88211 RepID=A0AAE1FIZ1_PETCI|nr:hypothetical protein Pcinc_020042 [Petrolisthes cinctipes]